MAKRTKKIFNNCSAKVDFTGVIAVLVFIEIVNCNFSSLYMLKNG